MNLVVIGLNVRNIFKDEWTVRKTWLNSYNKYASFLSKKITYYFTLHIPILFCPIFSIL